MKVALLFLILLYFCMEPRRHILDEATPQGAILRRLLSIKPAIPEIPDKIRILVGTSPSSKILYDKDDWTNWSLTPLEETNPLPACVQFDAQSASLKCSCVLQSGISYYYKGKHLFKATNKWGDEFKKTIVIEVAEPVTALESPTGMGMGIYPSEVVAVSHKEKLYLLFYDWSLLHFVFLTWDGKGNSASNWINLPSPNVDINTYPYYSLVSLNEKIYLVAWSDYNYPSLDLQLYAFHQNQWTFLFQTSLTLNDYSYIFQALSSKNFILFYISEFMNGTRFFRITETGVQEIQSLAYFFNHLSTTVFQDQVLLAPLSGANTIYSLNPNQYNWDFYSSWGGYYGTAKVSFRLFNYKENLYMGWTEKKPSSSHRDIRLVKKEGNDWVWLDGKKDDSEINYSQVNYWYADFVFIEDKIYSLFGWGQKYQSKVYKNQKWLPISEDVFPHTTLYNFLVNSNCSYFLAAEEVPIFVFMAFDNNNYQHKIFVRGLFEE